MLVTERASRLRIIRKGVLDPNPIAGTPAAYFAGESGAPGAVHGYMDIALHPKFAENHFVYLTYTKPLNDTKRTTAVARGTWDGHAITGMKDIFVLPEASTSRIAFGSDGMLYMTTIGQGSAGPQHAGRQSATAARRRERTQRQPVRGEGRTSAGGLHDGAPQFAGSCAESAHR